MIIIKSIFRGLITGFICSFPVSFVVWVIAGIISNNINFAKNIGGIAWFLCIICGCIRGLKVAHKKMKEVEAKEEKEEKIEKENKELRAKRERLRKCPKCDSSDTIVLYTIPRTYNITETKTRVTRRYNRDGEYIGHEESDFKFPVERTTYYPGHRKCNKCNHTWMIEWSADNQGQKDCEFNPSFSTITEKDTFWGNVIDNSILIGVIILVILLIGKMGNFSDPLQHTRSAPTSFSVIIDSSPSGAKVFINKKQVGITPYSTTLEPGSYGIRIEKEGYENAYRITEGEDRELNFKLKEE